MVPKGSAEQFPVIGDVPQLRQRREHLVRAHFRDGEAEENEEEDVGRLRSDHLVRPRAHGHYEEGGGHDDLHNEPREVDLRVAVQDDQRVVGRFHCKADVETIL